MPDALQSAPHWAAHLIGKPYRDRARGPEAFDCWGLCQYVWRLRLALDVPDMRAQAARAFLMAARHSGCAARGIVAVAVETSQELDAVYLSQRFHPHHVGVWIDDAQGGGVLHALEGAGVVFQRRADLTAHGFTIVKFMRLKAA